MKNPIGILVAVLLLAGLVFVIVAPGKPGTYDAFAKCIDESGATFYGAFWCPHCQRQKAEFGKSAALLPYEECSTPDGEGQLQVCQDESITTYPTWEFADGTRVDGVLTRAQLAEITGCELPQ